jgi:hypothetical protein
MYLEIHKGHLVLLEITMVSSTGHLGSLLIQKMKSYMLLIQGIIVFKNSHLKEVILANLDPLESIMVVFKIQLE